MISVEIPSNPGNLAGGWSAPVDTDLYWISLYSYMQCLVLDKLRIEGYTVRQLEESDGDDLVSGASAGIEQMLADISSSFREEV